MFGRSFVTMVWTLTVGGFGRSSIITSPLSTHRRPSLLAALKVDISKIQEKAVINPGNLFPQHRFSLSASTE